MNSIVVDANKITNEADQRHRASPNKGGKNKEDQRKPMSMLASRFPSDDAGQRRELIS
jgi:hypothetical protein